MSSLLNKSAVKKFILQKFKSMRAGPPMTRVSKEALDSYEIKLILMIESDILSHPSIGVTFKP